MSDVLAVHSISHSPVSRDAVAEILDVKGTLKSRSKEAAEWSDERRENCHDEDMEMVGRIWERRNVSSKLQETELSHRESRLEKDIDILDQTGRP